ncbi:hypothetical protein RF11_15014 [Thelohanellus kitauei]|uniref:Uncharacterized protein n=1 Tax=Thelohanellus kitauei TaxID=669202 RepID=A0A0C2M9V4_THEKT|nr:hypothetical protein RF11_15014 [Thelohanellus kitauei]
MNISAKTILDSRENIVDSCKKWSFSLILKLQDIQKINEKNKRGTIEAKKFPNHMAIDVTSTFDEQSSAVTEHENQWPGITEEIDKDKFGKREYSKARLIDEVWTPNTGLKGCTYTSVSTFGGKHAIDGVDILSNTCKNASQNYLPV